MDQRPFSHVLSGLSALVAVCVTVSLCISTVALAAPRTKPTAATAALKAPPFSREQFEEVEKILASKYIEKELTAPHIWAAAANGAVMALHRKVELLPSGFVALKKFSETRFSGRTAPFSCGGRALPGVVLHHVPKAKKGAKPYGAGGNSTGEALVDAILAWPPPFSRADFECVVSWVSGQILGRSDPAVPGSRLARLPDDEARRRRSEMWLTATRFMLRSLDPHSKLTTVEKWASLNAPVDSRTHEVDVSVRKLPGSSAFAWVRMSKFAPGGDERVRAGLRELQRKMGKRLEGVVLDMRNNGGGILPVAVGLVETFMRGGFVTRVKTRDAVAGVKVSRKRRQTVDVPLIVLVNERCASACEFTSGALQDGLRALIVGERTYGKATLQEYTALKTTNMRVMVTTAVFFSPTGHPIQATGIEPDVVATAKADGELTTRDREEDVPFHLQAETLASFRDVHFLRDEVRRCVVAKAGKGAKAGQGAKDGKDGKETKNPPDRQLRTAGVALACLTAARRSFAAGNLNPAAIVVAED